MTTSKFIGNIKSKEFHTSDCFTLKFMYNINQRPFYSEKQAISEGYDPCGHCLGIKKESEVKGGKGVNEYYFGQFYGIFNEVSTDNFSGIDVNYGEEIKVFAKLQKVVFADGKWTIIPVKNHEIDILCDFINFPAQKTDSEGLAKWNYTIPNNFEPGTTDMRVDAHIEENLIWHNGSDSLFFNVPQQIEILKNIPTNFDQETKIVFKLVVDKRIKADIYRGWSEDHLSHIKNLRDFNDGIMKANDKASLEWDGTIGHGFREGKPVMRGQYRIVIRGENGISDRDDLILNKKEGILGGVDPEPNEPNELNEIVSKISFSKNPFSKKTKTSLNFTLKKNATVSIHIQHINWNFRGNCKKEIISNEYLEKGDHSYPWDGKNNAGSPVTLGEYKVRIIANEETYVKTGLWKKTHWNL